MSIQFTCDDKQTLIAYLYGDIEPAARQVVDAHLARCRECADEVTALGHVRSELRLWVPPNAELDFTIVQKSALPGSNVLRPARWWDTVPVWAQAAAAVLVLAAGAGIANLQVKSGPDGFVVSTGWMPFDSSTTSSARGALVAQDTQPDEAWKPALVALEQQLRNEIKSTRDPVTRVASRGTADEATVRRVQQLINEAEQRQQRELAARLIDLTRDINMQRRADMQSISRVVGSYDEQLLRQRQMINNVYRVSGTPQQ
jgi:hypothetical protein